MRTGTTTQAKHSSMPMDTLMKGVPAFLQSLYQIVDDRENNNLIHWSPDGDSFYVREPDRFAREVLGKFFKHKNYQSFVRQLNNYGFNKILHPQQGALCSDGSTDYHHYKHSDFRRGQRGLLGRIQRKCQQAPDSLALSLDARDSSDPASIKKECAGTLEVVPLAGDISQNQLLQTILLDVSILKNRLSELETDNRGLREELGVVQGTVRQQQEAILCLLARLVPTSGYHWPRGHDPLMIQGVEESERPIISSPPSSPQPTVSEFLTGEDQADSTPPNTPISIDAALSSPPSSPPSSPSSSVEVTSQSTGALEHTPAYNQATLPSASDDSGHSSRAQDFPEDLAYSLFFHEHLASDSNTYNFDSDSFVDFPEETKLDHNYGMGDSDPGAFYDVASSLVESSRGHIVASEMTTCHNSGTHISSGDPTSTLFGVVGGKRKASAMDELQGIGPESASHSASLSLSPHDTHVPAEFISPASLLSHHDLPWAPMDISSFNPTTTTALLPSPKRAKVALTSERDNL